MRFEFVVEPIAMHRNFCVVQYILVFTEFLGTLAYQHQFSGRLSIDPGFTRLAGLPAVILEGWPEFFREEVICQK